MKRALTGTCLATLFGFAIVSAQTTPQTPPSAPQTPDPAVSSAKLDKEVKLTGCLKSGTDPGSFELSNVKKEGASTSASATAGTATAMAGDKTVKVTASPSVNLAAHVGHQIEVTGTWAAKASATPPAADAPATAKASKEFNITAVKMIASSCATGTN
jgi:hypothetical protein